ncbi:hypothetical protein CCUS01_14341 [Colletotrichum cuscutae]|uniref:Uncharacterized protein n=1 Tax=Colletotrichum cuscutae TaxID=1209917 RepID=A0AAI9Y975_9PEZI|nr:hypothetical protein CCUS01_14341 [Colletotrichum cuscutae]
MAPVRRRNTEAPDKPHEQALPTYLEDKYVIDPQQPVNVSTLRKLSQVWEEKTQPYSAESPSSVFLSPEILLFRPCGPKSPKSSSRGQPALSIVRGRSWTMTSKSKEDSTENGSPYPRRSRFTRNFQPNAGHRAERARSKAVDREPFDVGMESPSSH